MERRAQKRWIHRRLYQHGVARFADRPATLTIELAATANAALEVSAETWIRDLRIENAG